MGMVVARNCMYGNAGVDMGKLTAFVTLSDGSKPRLLKLYNESISKQIRKLHSERDRCQYQSNKWTRINERMKRQYKSLHNWQLNEYRHFCKQLCVDCDLIKFENLNLQQITRKGSGRSKNRVLKESKAGEVREWCTKKAPEHNTEIREVKPHGTSKLCHMCKSNNTERFGGFKTWHDNEIIHENWSHRRKFKCKNCNNFVHADYNGAFNIMDSPDHSYPGLTDYIKPNSKRAERYSKICAKSGSDLRDRIDLRNRIPPPVVGEWQVVKTATSRKRSGTPNKRTLNGSHKDPMNNNCILYLSI